MLGNWAADSYIGRFWAIMGPYMPKPPEYASPPPGWGKLAHVQDLFAAHPVELECERTSLDFQGESPEAYIDWFADNYGPLLQARNKLSAEGTWDDLRAELIALSAESNRATDGSFRAPSDYLVFTLRKRA